VIEFRTLGTLDLRESGGRELTSLLAQPKRVALLAYLCIATPRGYHRRDTLLGIFWPEADAGHARTSLRKALHVLRRALGNRALLTRGDEDVAVDSTLVWCDAVELEAALASQRIADGVALYAGDLLPGFFIDDAPAFERWLESERNRLRGIAAGASWTLAALGQSSGDVEAAVAAAKRAVQFGDWDEPGVRRLLELMDWSGDRAGALQVYEEFSRRLTCDFGAEPSAQTRALGDRLRACSPACDSSNRATHLAHREAHADQSRYPSGDEPAQSPVPIVVGAGGRIPFVPRRRRSHVAYGGGAALLLLGGAALAATALQHKAPALDPNLVLVAPFTVMDPQLAVWHDGIPELLARGLDDARPIRALPAVLPTPDSDRPPESIRPRELAARARAGLVLAGALMYAGGDSLRITASVVDVSSGRHIAELDVRDRGSRMDRLLDSLSLRTLRVLAALRSIDRYDHGLVGSADIGALKAYLAALQFARTGDHDSAVVYVNRAISLDSGFAQAWRLRGDVYWWCCDIAPVVRESFLRAARLNHGLPRSDSVQIAADSMFAELPWEGVPRRRRALGARLFALLEREVRYEVIDPPWWALGEARFHFWRLHSKSDTVGFASAAFLSGGSTLAPPGGANLHTLHEAMQRLDSARVRSMLDRVRKESEHNGRPVAPYVLASEAMVGGPSVDTTTLFRIAHASAGWQRGMINMLAATWPDADEAGVQYLRREASRAESAGTIDTSDTRRWLVMALLGRGHVREALDARSGDEMVAASAAHIAVLYGIPVSDTLKRPFGRWAEGAWSSVWVSLPIWSAARDTSSIIAAMRSAATRERRDSAGPNAFSTDAIEYDGPAYLALARGDTAAAIRAFDAVPDGACERGCEFSGLVHARLIAADRPGDALTILRSTRGVLYLRPYYAIERARIAERSRLYSEATTAYQHVIALLRSPDRELAPLVTESRTAVRRLHR
jgi:DNA-binding SARP family transcriptional activator